MARCGYVMNHRALSRGRERAVETCDMDPCPYHECEEHAAEDLPRGATAGRTYRHTPARDPRKER